MVRFEDLQVFVRAADNGSLSAAARQLDLSPAVASAALKRLEKNRGRAIAGAFHPQPAADAGRRALSGPCARGAGGGGSRRPGAGLAAAGAERG
ncbi:helix-turn-helix domain-containing protein, partial [Chromobacterium haemolyticum]|uniref:helix-turn-helix domain-containing protein n=1 Tax=Chromobacterium haemolyticum TaxID=394935 RepID=UPI001F078F7E